MLRGVRWFGFALQHRPQGLRLLRADDQENDAHRRVNLTQRVVRAPELHSNVVRRFAGEGRTSGGRHPCSPWGQLAKGLKTRNNKRTDGMIIKRRGKKG